MALQYRIIPVTPYEQNCSLLWCDETMEGALVDAGGDIPKLRAAVEKAGVKLVKLLVTHGHLDHVGGVLALAEELALPIEGPQREEKFWLDMLPQQAMMFRFPPARAFEPTRWLEDGDVVTVGKQEFEVRYCPGHTPGHVVFINHAAKLALVGDVLFAGSIGRTDFPRGDYDTLIQSIRSRLFTLGDDYRFVPGHGPMSTFGQEKATNPFVGGRFG